MDWQGQETKEMWGLHVVNGKVDVEYQEQETEKSLQEEKSWDILVH